jgi:hypothetical protein
MHGGDVPERSRLLGRSFTTTFDPTDLPVWEPLELLARQVGQAQDLPCFHPAEFMYMVAVRNQRLGLRIHLYKHRDTRCYLNLDEAGHAYAYQPSGDDGRSDRANFGGRYRRYRSLADALHDVDLWMLEQGRLLRSLPPEAWPC